MESTTHLSIYRQVAKTALMNWNGINDEEAEKIVMIQSFDELENQVWASSSLSYAVEALAQIFHLQENEKEHFKHIVIDKKNVIMSNYQQQFLEKLAKDENLIFNREKSILYVLSAIHDGWVKDNVKKFNQEGRELKRYQHLPLELIGWKEAKADLLFLAPILKEISGKEIDETALQLAYNNRIAVYLEKNGIETKTDLVRKIMKGSDFYPPLTEKNTAQTKEDAIAIVDKVFEVTPKIVAMLKATPPQI